MQLTLLLLYQSSTIVADLDLRYHITPYSSSLPSLHSSLITHHGSGFSSGDPSLLQLPIATVAVLRITGCSHNNSLLLIMEEVNTHTIFHGEWENGGCWCRSNPIVTENWESDWLMEHSCPLPHYTSPVMATALTPPSYHDYHHMLQLWLPQNCYS